jgi:hypothetical protein
LTLELQELQAAMDDSFQMSEREATANAFANSNNFFQRQAVVGRFLDQVFHITTGEQG